MTTRVNHLSVSRQWLDWYRLSLYRLDPGSPPECSGCPDIDRHVLRYVAPAEQPRVVSGAEVPDPDWPATGRHAADRRSARELAILVHHPTLVNVLPRVVALIHRNQIVERVIRSVVIEVMYGPCGARLRTRQRGPTGATVRRCRRTPDAASSCGRPRRDPAHRFASSVHSEPGTNLGPWPTLDTHRPSTASWVSVYPINTRTSGSTLRRISRQ